MTNGSIKIFTGRAHPELTQKICHYLDQPLGSALVSSFSDGEIRVELGENVRGSDCFIIQPGANPVNQNFMEMLVMIDAAKRASARRITAVIPYFSYARQDRKKQPRVPITAKLAADLITTAGANRILTMDLHCGQIQGFFNIPVDNLYASVVILPYIRSKYKENLAIIAPDANAVDRARAYKDRVGYGTTLGVIIKGRAEPGKSQKILEIIGDVVGRTVLVLDDMIDTFGTMSDAIDAILKAGAKRIIVAATHAVLSGPAMQRIKKSRARKLIVTDTLPLPKKSSKKIMVLSVAEIFAKAIERIHQETPISDLFELNC